MYPLHEPRGEAFCSREFSGYYRRLWKRGVRGWKRWIYCAGIVMIIMALDHTREYLHVAGAGIFQPEDLTRTTAVLFSLRAGSRTLCLPVFMFTAGAGRRRVLLESPQTTATRNCHGSCGRAAVVDLCWN